MYKEIPLLDHSGRSITWIELERLAFDPSTPEELAKQYQKQIKSLLRFNCREFYVGYINKGQLVIDNKGFCRYNF